MTAPLLVVFSHLRWDFVFQRPQHLMSRLAGRWRVLFVEEPLQHEGPARLALREPLPGLTVATPHTPLAAPGFHDDQLATLQALLDRHLAAAGPVDVAWLYTPMALPLVKGLDPGCVVYDCMDELSAFKDAPRQLRQREAGLLRQAALVLCGGPSLYEARRHQHPHVVCLPSAVDAAHFAPVSLVPGSAQAIAAEGLQGRLPRPRLGFYGVIDERLDLPLVAALADAQPEGSVVMAGPVVKIDPASLPRRRNLHWLGMQPYERLPYLLAGWDIALMPFARNDSTRFISPTKTLEYLAGEKPVVSTAIRDVIALYGDVVTVADNAPAFVAACARLLAESPAARCRRALDTLNGVARFSWDRSATSVHELLQATLARQRARPLRAAAAPAPVAAAAGLRHG